MFLTRLWGRCRISGEFVWNTPDFSRKAKRACSYFDFHAAPVTDGVSPKTHGLFPVWGFGDIVASNHSIAKVGERVYGYFAPARYLGKCSSWVPADNQLSEVHYSSGILHERLERFLLLRAAASFTTRYAFSHRIIL